MSIPVVASYGSSSSLAFLASSLAACSWKKLRKEIIVKFNYLCIFLLFSGKRGTSIIKKLERIDFPARALELFCKVMAHHYWSLTLYLEEDKFLFSVKCPQRIMICKKVGEDHICIQGFCAKSRFKIRNLNFHKPVRERLVYKCIYVRWRARDTNAWYISCKIHIFLLHFSTQFDFHIRTERKYL